MKFEIKNSISNMKRPTSSFNYKRTLIMMYFDALKDTKSYACSIHLLFSFCKVFSHLTVQKFVMQNLKILQKIYVIFNVIFTHALE